MSKEFEPRKRTAIDGKVWWVVYDLRYNHYATNLLFGKYKTKRDCQYNIDRVVKLCGKLV